MALFTKSLESAQADLAKAEAVVAEWEGKERTTREEAASLDAGSGALILEDASFAETVSLKIQVLERQARAYGAAAAEARAKALACHRALLDVEALHEDKLAATASKSLKRHEASVADLLSKLRALEGVEYMVAPRIDSVTNQIDSYGPETTSLVLTNEITLHKYRAGAIRYFLTNGEIPADTYLLDIDRGYLNLGITGMSPQFSRTLHLPASVTEAQAAGLAPEQTAEV